MFLIAGVEILGTLTPCWWYNPGDTYSMLVVSPCWRWHIPIASADVRTRIITRALHFPHILHICRALHGGGYFCEHVEVLRTFQ